MNRFEWIASVQNTEDLTALALQARDRTVACRQWLGWQLRRGKLDRDDAAAALEGLELALAVVESTLDALRSYRASLRSP